MPIPEEEPKPHDAVNKHLAKVNPSTIEDGLAAMQGLKFDGEPMTPQAQQKNLRTFGAESPRQRYTTMMPAITLEDLAKDWGFPVDVVRVWFLAGKWDEVRAAYLDNVPLEMGGRLATGDLVAYKHNLIYEHLAELRAARQIVNKRLAERTEEQVGKMTVEELRKTSKSINEDVQSLVSLEGQERTTLGLPTKYSASMTHSVSERKQISHTTTHEPARTTRQRTESFVQTNQLSPTEIVTTREITLEAE